MQPTILFLLLGWVAVVNSFGLDLRFLNPLRTSDEHNEQPPLPPMKPNMCKPMEPMTLIRKTREPQLLRNDQQGSFIPLPTLAPTNNPGDPRTAVPLPTLAPTKNPRDFTLRSLVPLPTSAPTAISTTQQNSRSADNGMVHPLNDCEPLPIGISTRLSSQLLKILTILG